MFISASMLQHLHIMLIKVGFAIIIQYINSQDELNQPSALINYLLCFLIIKYNCLSVDDEKIQLLLNFKG